jgi:hypothetical protein
LKQHLLKSATRPPHGRAPVTPAGKRKIPGLFPGL